MNDYQMIHLANDRSHALQRQAADQRLANSVRARTASGSRSHAPAASTRRGAVRLTLDHLLGRSVA